MRRQTIPEKCRAAAWLIAIASLVLPAPAIGQSGERKPPPTAQDQTKKDDRASPPRPAKPAPREKRPGDERIRIDAPVSFPVDI